VLELIIGSKLKLFGKTSKLKIYDMSFG